MTPKRCREIEQLVDEYYQSTFFKQKFTLGQYLRGLGLEGDELAYGLGYGEKND